MKLLTLFFLVSLASTAIPGPAVLYVTTQGMRGGMRSGLPTAFGILAADAFYIVLSVTGLSAILAASYQLFTIMKWAGALYLVYLGVRLVISGFSAAAAPAVPEGDGGTGRSFLSGFALHAANPKALLYFGSLVPQFVVPGRPVAMQLAALALVHLTTASCVLIFYAASSSWLRRSGVNARIARLFRIGAGASLIGAGVSLGCLRRSAP